MLNFPERHQRKSEIVEKIIGEDFLKVEDSYRSIVEQIMYVHRASYDDDECDILAEIAQILSKTLESKTKVIVVYTKNVVQNRRYKRRCKQ